CRPGWPRTVSRTTRRSGAPPTWYSRRPAGTGRWPRPAVAWASPSSLCPEWTSRRRCGRACWGWPSSSWTATHEPEQLMARSTATPAPAPPQGVGRDRGSPAAAALAAAVAHLRGLQDERGWWQGELQTNVTMDAEDLLMREFLGIRTEQVTQEAARWIRSQ